MAELVIYDNLLYFVNILDDDMCIAIEDPRQTHNINDLFYKPCFVLTVK